MRPTKPKLGAKRRALHSLLGSSACALGLVACPGEGQVDCSADPITLFAQRADPACWPTPSPTEEGDAPTAVCAAVEDESMCNACLRRSCCADVLAYGACKTAGQCAAAQKEAYSCRKDHCAEPCG